MGAAGKIGRGIGGTIKWIVLAGAALIVVLVTVMMVSLGSAVDESDDSSAAVGPAKYQQIELGMTQQQVRRIIGAEPQDQDETAVQGMTMSCWYYGILSAEGMYQFCFNNGRLETKSRI